MCLMIGKFQLKVVESVTIHPPSGEVLSWVFWGNKREEVRKHKATLDSDVRNQTPHTHAEARSQHHRS